MKKNCDTCIYKGELEPDITRDRHGYMVETRYIGIRCTNKDCIFYRSPIIPIVNAGLDNCKGFKEVYDDSDNTNDISLR